ncbi:hypothetical protein [Micromonospora sp. NPDC048063]|uniref:hypothetical protein n=1 Tax=Micromonospora sp. NPDC048063 TaxID=3364256 RepID=UPI003721AEE3
MSAVEPTPRTEARGVGSSVETIRRQWTMAGVRQSSSGDDVDALAVGLQQESAPAKTRGRIATVCVELEPEV